MQEAWMKWADKSVQEAYEGELVLLESARLVGLLILVFARSSFISQVGLGSSLGPRA